MQCVYKICDRALWDEACAAGEFTGAGIDLADGYIHFSTAGQVAETAFLHFNGISGLVLVAVPEEAVALTWEKSRDGSLFPHLYGTLPVEAVAWVEDLELGEDGLHRFPKVIPAFVPPPSSA
ncbi:MAG: DUF952 domain-containing protein [Candidatus Puniceispirillales bacterium]